MLDKSKDTTYHDEIQELVLRGYDSAIYLVLMALKDNPNAQGQELISLAESKAKMDSDHSSSRADSEPRKVEYINSVFKFDNSFIDSFAQTSVQMEIDNKYINKLSTPLKEPKAILETYKSPFFFTPPRIQNSLIDINYKSNSHSDSNNNFSIIESISEIPCSYEEARIVQNLEIDINLIKGSLNQVYDTSVQRDSYISKEDILQKINYYLSGLALPVSPIKKHHKNIDLDAFDAISILSEPKKPLEKVNQDEIESLLILNQEDEIDLKLDITDLTAPQVEDEILEQESVKPKKIGFWKKLFGKKEPTIQAEENYGVAVKEIYQIDENELKEIKAKPREARNFETELIVEVDESELADVSAFETVKEPADFKIKPKSYYEEIQLVEALDSLDAITIDPNANGEAEVEELEVVGTIEASDYDVDKELENKTVGGNISLSLGAKAYVPESEKIAGVQDLSPNVIDLTKLSKTKRKWWVFSKKEKTKEEVLEEVLRPAVAPAREVAIPEDAKEIFFPNRPNYMISDSLKLSLEEDEIKIDLSDTSQDRKIESDFIKEAIIINPGEAKKNKNTYDFLDEPPALVSEEEIEESSPTSETLTNQYSLEESIQDDELNIVDNSSETEPEEEKEKIAEAMPLLPPRPEINSRQLIRDISIIDTED